MGFNLKTAVKCFDNETSKGKCRFFSPQHAQKIWWCLIASLALTDAIWLALAHISVKPASALLPGLTIAGLLAIGNIYKRWRPDPRLATLANTGAVLLAFGVVGGVFSYLVVTLDYPLFDEHVVAADRLLGFDWLRQYAVFRSHPVFRIAMTLIYGSPVTQIFLVLAVLNYLGMFQRSCEFTWLFIITSLGCVIISGLLPTAGAFIYFHIPVQDPYVKAFLDLRAGQMPVIDLNRLEGVVQFPSFHLALAVLFVYAMRGIRYWFPLMLIFNAVVIAATPAIGGHHLTDLIGGAVMTMAAIGFVRRAMPSAKQSSRPA